MEATNGKPVLTPHEAEKRLSAVMTTGYTPTPFADQFWGTDGTPYWWLRRDIPLMLTHPMVRNALNYYKSGIAGAEFWGGANPDNPDDEKGVPISEDDKVSAFVLEQCERFWDRGVPALQRGYDFGWVGAENIFAHKEGVLQWDSVNQFAPRDTFILTQDYKPVGVRVKNVKEKGQVDLWFASGDIPAKGLWYAHDPLDGLHYGQSQLFGAWRPWRRLAWKDGAETILDCGFYRFAFAGPMIRYPDEDYQSQPGVPSTTLDSQGLPRRYARDMARMMAEQAKAGAGIGLPSGNYPPEMGGGEKWSVTWPTQVLNMAPVTDYCKTLADQISYGIGVPPELLQAAETGSGFSGRMIPMEAFLNAQQKIADAMLQLFIEQVLKPLVIWNFGMIPFAVKVKPLLRSRSKQRQGQEGQQSQPGQAQPPGQNPPEAPVQKPLPHGAFSVGDLVTDRVRDIARLALQRRAA